MEKESEETSAEDVVRQRKYEDSVIEEARTATDAKMAEDHMVRLSRQRRELRAKLNALDVELGEGRIERTWLRKLPEWFWIPAHITHMMLNSQTAIKHTGGIPMLQNWQRYADLSSFGFNALLGILYISFVLALLGMLV